MASQEIRFGTSGWRGVIADDFTFGCLRRASTAIAAHLRARAKSPKVIIGYDTRFLSEEFARTAASILRSQGCGVLMCQEATPTPAIAHAILHGRLDGGVNITASHNPSRYNGLKFSGHDAAPASPEVTRDIETRAAAIPDGPADDHHEIPNDFEPIDPREPYFKKLEGLVQFDIIREAHGTFVCDALHGCGAGWLDGIFRRNDIDAPAIRADRDVLFDGVGPDPSDQNLMPLAQAVREEKALAGLATDGDADRFGIIDSDGAFVSPNHILGLLYDYLLETRGHKLGASRSVATTHLIDAVAELHGAQVYETPVGFQYVVPFLRQDKIALGAEESAGMTIRGHLPEKDGILACLLTAEMIAARKAPLARQLRDLFRRLGREFWPVGLNLHVGEDVRQGLPERLKENFHNFARKRVIKTDRTDGLKLTFADGEWLLVRPSGTEPVVRIYTEAATSNASQKLAQEASSWIGA